MMTPPISPLSAGAMRLHMSFPGDWRRPDDGDCYYLYWSADDQYGMLHPRPTPAQVAAFYELNDYYTHQYARDRHDPQSFAPRLLLHLAWLFDKGVELDDDWCRQRLGKKTRRVLDIGCGDGRLLSHFRQAGHETVGVEPDARARRIAQGRGLTVYDGTAERLPTAVSKQRFDMVLMTHTLEHVINPLQALRNVHNILNVGGRLVVETPNNAALGLKQAGITWRWLDVPRHLNFFTARSLQAMCHKAGLEPAEVEYRGYARQFRPDWLQEQHHIWQCYRRRLNGNSSVPVSKQPSLQLQWRLLLRTLMAPNVKKYDSVRVLAVKRA